MKNQLGLILFGACLFLCGLGAGAMLVPLPENPATAQVCSPELLETWKRIKEQHVGSEVTDAELQQGAIRGLVASLKDPHSAYFEPKTAKFIKENSSGEFCGIGAQVGFKDGYPVLDPQPGSPAQKAGILKGDAVLAVDGQVTDDQPLLETVARIRGAKDTAVKLTLGRAGSDAPLELTVVRDKVVVESVKTETISVGKNTYEHITVTDFHEDTDRLFGSAVGKAVGNGADGVILDLRNNPGGFLNAAVTMACRWKSGVTIVSVEMRGKPPKHLNCRGDELLFDMPTVVLVNGDSASASEVVTGALQDFGKAHVIGTKTYGKGCGQNGFTFEDGGELRLTTFLWKTPKGRLIHKKGLMPDEIVDRTKEDIKNDKDPQLDRAVQYLSTGGH